ncbi:MAG: thiol:disulfide interchange protein DsbA/DsbL [Candidatus Parcubacteria bacterium]|nr:thiol:disulfide interchange protein DsbA/DsbL [Burkholderiales bacterium]
MDQLRRAFAAAIALSPLAALLARAQDGTSYTTLKNELPVETPGKIEIAEFFWYGCIHCFNLEPLLEKWVPSLPADTQFRRVPAVFNERWAHDAAIYYAFEAMGSLDKLHRPFFEAIHKDRLKTDNPAALSEWLTRNGVDPRKLEAAMKSFGVQSKVKRATQLTAASRIDGTPALMVHGRYTISTEQGRSREGMLATADSLAGIVRKSLPRK